MYACMYVCMHVCMYVCVYIYNKYIYNYIHIYMIFNCADSWNMLTYSAHCLQLEGSHHDTIVRVQWLFFSGVGWGGCFLVFKSHVAAFGSHIFIAQLTHVCVHFLMWAQLPEDTYTHHCLRYIWPCCCGLHRLGEMWNQCWRSIKDMNKGGAS